MNQAEALTHHAGTLNPQVQSWGKGHVWTTKPEPGWLETWTGKSLPQSWPSLARASLTSSWLPAALVLFLGGSMPTSGPHALRLSRVLAAGSS